MLSMAPACDLTLRESQTRSRGSLARGVRGHRPRQDSTTRDYVRAIPESRSRLGMDTTAVKALLSVERMPHVEHGPGMRFNIEGVTDEEPRELSQGCARPPAAAGFNDP